MNINFLHMEQAIEKGFQQFDIEVRNNASSS